MGFSAGEWIAPYTQVLDVLESGGTFETYRVLHGDAVPREILLRRYRIKLPIETEILREAAYHLRLYELRVVGDLDDAVLEIYGDNEAITTFHARFTAPPP